jgi:hypothetical protein
VTNVASAGIRALYRVREQLAAHRQDLTLITVPGSSVALILELAHLSHAADTPSGARDGSWGSQAAGDFADLLRMDRLPEACIAPGEIGELPDITAASPASRALLRHITKQGAPGAALGGGSNPAPVCVLDWWAGIFDRPG